MADVRLPVARISEDVGCPHGTSMSDLFCSNGGHPGRPSQKSDQTSATGDVLSESILSEDIIDSTLLNSKALYFQSPNAKPTENE